MGKEVTGYKERGKQEESPSHEGVEKGHAQYVSEGAHRAFSSQNGVNVRVRRRGYTAAAAPGG